jgi:hypothetical protein
MTDAPSAIAPAQLRDLHVQVLDEPAAESTGAHGH